MVVMGWGFPVNFFGIGKSTPPKFGQNCQVARLRAFPPPKKVDRILRIPSVNFFQETQSLVKSVKLRAYATLSLQKS